jgi:hypothetical protein
MRATLATLAAALGIASSAAFACGHCIEDKIAAAYDHAVVRAALARGHQVVFFALDGKLAGTEAERRMIEHAAQAAHGVDPGTVRASSEYAALSVAFDPAHVGYAALMRSLQYKFTRRGLTLLPLRVMDSPAELKTAARP